MNRYLMRGLFIFMLLPIAACQNFLSSPSAKPTPYLPLLSPASLSQSLAVAQKVTGEGAGEQYVLIFQWEVEQDRLAMVASTSGGNTLFSLSYQNEKLDTSVSPLVPLSIDPAFILADLQLTFWPVAVIEKALEDSGYYVRDSERGRQLLQGDEVVINIKYSQSDRWRGQVELDNLRWNYHYRIDNLSIEYLDSAFQKKITGQSVAAERAL